MGKTDKERKPNLIPVTRLMEFAVACRVKVHCIDKVGSPAWRIRDRDEHMVKEIQTALSGLDGRTAKTILICGQAHADYIQEHIHRSFIVKSIAPD